jgi:predicted metal-dependent hydrolase
MQDLVSIFSIAHRELRPRRALPDIRVEFFPFAGLNHTARLHENRLVVRLSDIFRNAPAEIYHSLALILLAKLYRKKVDTSHHRTYRTFILTEDIQERARVARTHRGRLGRPIASRGRHIDLNVLFDELNEKYFAGSIDKPQLSWSAKKARYVLGRYDSTHHTIYISRVFDTPNFPPYVVEYVMFHEMLHVKHQSQVHDSRLIVHTPEFKKEERSFSHYQEAMLWLKGI